jgi:hypothetical protein
MSRKAEEYSREKLMAPYIQPPFGFIVLSPEQAEDTKLVAAIKEAWPRIKIVTAKQIPLS